MVRAAVWILLAAAPTPGRQPNAARYFDERVAPILEKRCLPCHNEQLKNGNISFLDRDSLLSGGTYGPAIIPGRPDKSLLIATLRHEGELQMPPGPKLSKKETAVLTKWIKLGAIWGTRLRK